MRLGPVVAASLALAGCAEHWAKPGATPAERDATLARCEAESQARFPPVLQTIMLSPGYFSPPQTRCRAVNNQSVCHTVGGFWNPPVFQTIDLAADARRTARYDCMYSRGWILAKDEKTAEAVTKSAPPPPLPPPLAPPLAPPATR
jgi:hypothetical protein